MQKLSDIVVCSVIFLISATAQDSCVYDLVTFKLVQLPCKNPFENASRFLMCDLLMWNPASKKCEKVPHEEPTRKEPPHKNGE